MKNRDNPAPMCFFFRKCHELFEQINQRSWNMAFPPITNYQFGQDHGICDFRLRDNDPADAGGCQVGMTLFNQRQAGPKQQRWKWKRLQLLFLGEFISGVPWPELPETSEQRSSLGAPTWVFANFFSALKRAETEGKSALGGVPNGWCVCLLNLSWDGILWEMFFWWLLWSNKFDNPLESSGPQLP